MTQTYRPPELALPVASLAALRRALEESVGPETAAHALQSAGNAAGDAFYQILGGGPEADTSPAEWGESVFWRRLSDLFSRRGWGRIANEAVHAGVGAIDAFDWVESDPELAASRPGCAFTAGLIANLLGRVTGSEVAVLEVECRSQGDARCRFLYGSPVVLDAVYNQLRSGTQVDDSLAALY